MPQITTCRGIIMGRLRSPQRSLEVSLMKFCLQKLGGLMLLWFTFCAGLFGTALCAAVQ